MRASVSRRAFLAALGGAVAAQAATWEIGRHIPRRPAVESNPVSRAYVDHDGWILTTADKQKLTTRPMRILEDIDFPAGGSDLGDRVVADAAACAAWCQSTPDCQSFSYAKPGHPDAGVRNRCWLKGSGDLTGVADPRFTSGTR
jgi:hypothetical protein